MDRLESLRTQLLASVSHELKRPVASISGLLQAMKDNIVTCEKRERFLEVCLKDSKRLQKMVEDLLADADGFRMEVRDAGHGIPPDEQPDIFEPFYRGSRKKPKVRGLGIGLPFSRLIARSLGGDLALANSSPAGTTFILHLPAG